MKRVVSSCPAGPFGFDLNRNLQLTLNPFWKAPCWDPDGEIEITMKITIKHCSLPARSNHTPGLVMLPFGWGEAADKPPPV